MTTTELNLTSQELDLESRIVNMLHRRPSLRDVQVEVVQGTVFLSGLVQSFYEKQLCIAGAQRVAGVYRLVDRTNVAPIA